MTCSSAPCDVQHAPTLTSPTRPEVSTQFIAQAGADGLLVVMFVNCNSGTSPLTLQPKTSIDPFEGTQASYKLSMVFENFDDDGQPYHVGCGDKQLPPLFSAMTVL